MQHSLDGANGASVSTPRDLDTRMARLFPEARSHSVSEPDGVLLRKTRAGFRKREQYLEPAPQEDLRLELGLEFLQDALDHGQQALASFKSAPEK
ncbi:hypothetical protein [Citreicoccus inhibens]|uniref:hypothetical protein n=1 Tax=Citreicoccus inhibens TaxID=2849499 RepID=UPI001F2B6C30|nr:hypothetical protein [Citreicoccus inhibens]